jgi:hypothetical protein
MVDDVKLNCCLAQAEAANSEWNRGDLLWLMLFVASGVIDKCG